jgi:hypothetical protein
MCISAYHFTTDLPLLLPCIIILFLHFLSTNHKCTQPCYFPLLWKPATQKLKKNWSTLIRCSRWAIATDRLPVVLWHLSAVMLPRVFDLFFCKKLFDNKYYILWHWLFCIHFLYGMCVNLIPGHTNYEHSDLASKPDVTSYRELSFWIISSKNLAIKTRN